jgi:predicted Rossmann fold nucleotide-binding protein DprA/Smf involved in DNA uptake
MTVNNTGKTQSRNIITREIVARQHDLVVNFPSDIEEARKTGNKKRITSRTWQIEENKQIILRKARLVEQDFKSELEPEALIIVNLYR